MNGSVLGPLLRELRRRYHAGKAEVGRDSWRRWQFRVLVGIIGMVVLMFVLVQIGQYLVTTGRLGWEPDFLLWLGEHGPFPFYTAVFFQTIGTDITMYILLTFTAGIAIWHHRPLTGLSILLAFVVSDLVGRLGWLIWARARPSVLYDGVASPGFHSFPSGHTSKTVAVYGLLIYLWLRHSKSLWEKLLGTAVILFVSVAVPLGRVSMGVHWPSDIVAGWILGGAWMAFLAWALRYESASRADR